MATHSDAPSVTLDSSISVTLDTEVTTSQSVGSTKPGDGIPTVTGDVTLTELSYKDGQYYWKVTKTETDPSDSTKTTVRSAWINANDINITDDTFKTDEEATAYYATFLSDETQNMLAKAAEADRERAEQARQAQVSELSSDYGVRAGGADDDISVNGSSEFTIMNIEPGSEIGMLDAYINKMSRTFGLPPQWNGYVDRRLPVGNSAYIVGRRYMETIMSSPTILSLCPGKIQPSNALADAAATASTEMSATDLISSLTSGTFEPFWKFEEVWMNGFGGGGYIDCCNVLCAYAACCMAINDSLKSGNRQFLGGEGKFTDLTVPWGGSTYGTINVNDLLDPTFNSERLDYATGFGDFLSRWTKAASHVDTHFVHFNANGGMSVEDQFDTTTRQSVIEQVINGGISNTVKDIAFMTNGAIGGEVESDLASVKDIAISSLGGTIGSLVGAAMEIMHGGAISFPKVIDDCTWGRSFTFTVKFTSVYADTESRFLNVVMPYLCLACFFLPKQLKNTIDMYTYPPVVRAFARGVYACDCGVLTGISVKRGGEDDTAWTANGQPMEIDVSFSIQSLHSRLMQSDSKIWFIKNTGMQMYIGTLCGIDMTVNQAELIKLTAAAFTKGFFMDVRRNVSYGIWRLINNNPINRLARSLTSAGGSI